MQSQPEKWSLWFALVYFTTAIKNRFTKHCMQNLEYLNKNATVQIVSQIKI